MVTECLTIGDTSIDNYLILDHDEADIRCHLKDKECQLCFDLSEKIPVKETHEAIGGNACNAAVGMSRLGINTAINTTVGRDDDGKKIIYKLEKEDVGIDQVKQEGTTNKTVAIIYKDRRTLLVHHQKRQYDFTSGAKWIYLTSMAPGSEEINHKISKYINENNSKLVFSPGTYQRRAGAHKYKEILEICDAIVMNLQEAQDYTQLGDVDIKKLLDKLQEFGPSASIITDGEKGAYGSDGMAYFKCKAARANLVEPTGAGDAFAASMTAALISGEDLPETLAWGAVNSASVVEHIGPQKGLLSITQLRHRLENQDLVEEF